MVCTSPTMAKFWYKAGFALYTSVMGLFLVFLEMRTRNQSGGEDHSPPAGVLFPQRKPCIGDCDRLQVTDTKRFVCLEIRTAGVRRTSLTAWVNV